MTKKEKEKMGQRIKEEIKNKYGTIRAANNKIGEKNIGNYTGREPREPRAGILIKLGKAGCDMKYILLDKRENDCTIRIKQLEEEVKELKVELYDKIKKE